MEIVNLSETSQKQETRNKKQETTEKTKLSNIDISVSVTEFRKESGVREVLVLG
jgi:hypothetical protein